MTAFYSVSLPMRLIDMSSIYLETVVYIFIIVLDNDIIPKNLNILSDNQPATRVSLTNRVQTRCVGIENEGLMTPILQYHMDEV